MLDRAGWHAGTSDAHFRYMKARLSQWIRAIDNDKAPACLPEWAELCWQVSFSFGRRIIDLNGVYDRRPFSNFHMCYARSKIPALNLRLISIADQPLRLQAIYASRSISIEYLVRQRIDRDINRYTRKSPLKFCSIFNHYRGAACHYFRASSSSYH